MAEIEDSFIPTRASLAKKNSNPEAVFQSQTFKAYKKKVQNKGPVSTLPEKNNESDESNRSVFKIKKAKHEVMKFGITGFETLKKREAKIQLAIKLGAKPPKKRYRNYKKLLEEKKKEKAVKETEVELTKLGKDSLGNSTAQKKQFRQKRKRNQSIIELYGTTKVEK